MIDILGNYPQAEGSYYKTVADSQTANPSSDFGLFFTGVERETNITHTPGTAEFYIVHAGFYLITTQIQYDSTPPGYGSYFSIQLGGPATRIAYANTQTDVPIGTITTTYMSVSTYTYLETGNVIQARFLTFAPGGHAVINGQYSTFFKVIRLR